MLVVSYATQGIKYLERTYLHKHGCAEGRESEDVLGRVAHESGRQDAVDYALDDGGGGVQTLWWRSAYANVSNLSAILTPGKKTLSSLTLPRVIILCSPAEKVTRRQY